MDRITFNIIVRKISNGYIVSGLRDESNMEVEEFYASSAEATTRVNDYVSAALSTLN